ncbi:MAG: gliding motility-associated C-terminal domain-containing protein [Bacteroidia bacterium]
MRKTILFTLLILSPLFWRGAGGVAKAQTWFVVPDSQFVAFLTNDIPAAMHGDSLNTSSPLVTTMLNMNIQAWNIVNLSGVEYFASLKNLLSINGCPKLAIIPVLPASLQSIQLINCPHLKSLPVLPNSLTNLTCRNDSLTSLPILPNSLAYLGCSINYLTSLPALPNSLTSLDCGGNPLYNLPVLPSNLIQLACSQDSLTSLPALPSSLKYLLCDLNQLSNLPALPDSLIMLYCLNNKLTNLPALPNTLLALECYNNNITCFPTFPDSITDFQIFNNPFTCLPNYIKAMDSLTRTYPLCELGNPNGCIAVVPIVVAIPNIFTPNGDNINDEFFITIKGESVTNFSCKIYDRWGLLVYQGSDVNSGWNGKDKGGIPAIDGTYFYVITYTDVTGKTFNKNGFLQLLR